MGPTGRLFLTCFFLIFLVAGLFFTTVEPSGESAPLELTVSPTGEEIVLRGPGGA